MCAAQVTIGKHSEQQLVGSGDRGKTEPLAAHFQQALFKRDSCADAGQIRALAHDVADMQQQFATQHGRRDVTGAKSSLV